LQTLTGSLLTVNGVAAAESLALVTTGAEVQLSKAVTV